VRREWMSAREVAEVLGLSQRHARRLARPYLVGMWTDYAAPKPARTAYYRADAVMQLARARAGSTCTVCGATCRPHATTCGTDACACKAYRQRRDERARADRKARGIAW